MGFLFLLAGSTQLFVSGLLHLDLDVRCAGAVLQGVWE